MKQKHFILALVAMLSFAFSAFAQTTVTTEAELKEALASTTNSSIVLGNDIEQSSSINIAKGISHILELNGHKVTAKSTLKDFLFKVNGNLTINDSDGNGELIGTIKTLYCVAGGCITINGGKITSATGNPVYATGNVIVNGGSVLSNGSGVAISTTGAYANVTLTDGVVSSINFASKGNLEITGANATVENGIIVGANAKGVTITAGTINGDVTVADEAKDKVTVSGGNFEDADISEYLEEGKSLDENGNVVQSKVTVAKVGDVEYSDIQEAIKAAAPAGTVDVLADVTVDKWVMFAEKMTIGDGSLITLNINGLTINGNNKNLTVKSIESAGNGGYLFYDAQNLTVKDLTINIADGLVGGIGLQQGTISNVTFNGGQYGVLPGKNGVTVSGCTFNDTKGYAVYYEDARPGIVVTGNTFNTADGKYAITMRSDEQFTDNTIIKGRVNLANSAKSTVTDNDFGTERFKVYNSATATISNNKINNLVFNETTAPAASTFTADNTLSAEAQAAIEALPVMAGDGTEANPYTIGNLTQLKAFRDKVNAGNNYQGKFVKLTADIDLNNEEWTPIATFNGVFNGNDKTISNLVVNGAGKSNQGFFGQTNNGEIKNLTINNAKVTGRLNVGVVAGTPYTSKYTNIKVTGHVEVNGMAYVGGVGGKNAYANWTDITVDVSNDSYVKATSTENGTAYRTYVGGVIGFNGEGGHTFKNISSNIKVIGDVCDIGGIFGILHYGNKVETVTFAGQVEAPAGAKEVGAIAGVWHNQVGQSVTINNATIADGSTVKVGDVTTTGSIVGGAYNAANQSPETSGSLKVDGKEVWVGLAKVGEVPYETLAAAVAAAQANETVTLLGDITMSDILVINKSITIDGNDKKLTYTGTNRAIDVPNDANAVLDVTIKNLNLVATTANRGLNYNENGKFNVEGVTVTIGENVDGYAINFPGMADGAQVTIKDSKLTSRNPLNIWGENMIINVHNSEIISVDNSSTYDYAAIQLNNEIPTAGPNGAIANGTVVNVYGGKITALNDNNEPSNVVANATETGVVNISDETVITGKVLNYVANIGGVYFGSLQAAVDAIEKYGYNSPIVIMKSFATSETATVKNGLNVTIDLAGKTITVTDNTTKNFEAIKNQGTLTIKDSSADKTGKITVTATTNSGWNRYSAVIANTVGGKLTVDGGTFEHLGGTDMAYGIDNLTNGKGTYAETIINGGTIKSTYRAIRQFLNGTEAQNILTVNGGTIEGINKSIWMQEPNANANNGALTVAADAAIKGDVYLSANASATEWPVTVAVAAAALKDGSKVLTSNVPAGYDVAEVNGTYGVFSGAAKIGTTYYATIDEAIKAAKAGETVNILAGTYPVPAMKAGITVEGAVNADGTPAVLLEGTLSGTLENLTLKNLHIKGGNAQRWGYAKGNLMFENVIFEATSVYAIHFDGITEGANLTYKNCTIIGWAAMSGSPESCVFDSCTIKGNGSYGVIRTYFDAEIKDCTFDVANVNTNDAYEDGIHAVDGAEVVVNECTNENGTMKDLVNIHGTSEVTVDGVVYKNVAKVGDKNYITIEDAFAAWADGTTLTLLTDITMDTKDIMSICDGKYPTFVLVEGKSVTLDLNGKNITANAHAEDLQNLLIGVFTTDNGGKLTIKDSKGTATVTLNANDAKVYSVLCNYEEGCQIKVEGGTFVADKLSDSMIYSGTDAGENEGVTIDGGKFILGNLGQDPNPDNAANGKPWIFNTLGGNVRNVVVNGGTFNADVNHQFWANEVFVPENKALKDNGDGTWTVVDAVAYTMELATSTGATERKVGYATLHDAIAAVKETETITLVKDITYTKDNADVNGEYVDGFVYTGDKSFTIDFNGKTITENGDINDYLVYLKNTGDKDNEITFKNGTIAVAESTAAWAAITVGANSATCKTTLNLDGMKVVNGNPNDANNQVIRVRKGSVVNLNEGTEVTSNGTSYGVVAETTATVNINKGAKVVQTNSKTTGGNQVYTAVSGNGTINVYDGAEIVSDNYGIHNLTTGNTVINIYGGSITAKVAVHTATNGGNGESAVANISGGTFTGKLEAANDDASIVVSGGTFDQAVDEKFLATGYICKENTDGTFGVIKSPDYGMVAQIGEGELFENQYFATINEAAQAAKTGDVIKLIADVNMSAAGYATIDETDKYSTMMAVKEKDITLDMNGKTITVTPTADELADAEMQMLMSVFGMDTNGKLTITGNGTVKVVANGANVYSLATAYGEGSQITIENGNFEVDKLMLSGSLLYSQQSECMIVKGGNFHLGNLADPEGQNGQPWVFNTKGQNYTGAIVTGGTFPTDINHQFWAHEVSVPQEFALKNNGDDTWTVVPSVAYTSEKATSRGSYFRNVGYASIEEAIAATDKYNCEGNVVTLVKSVEIEKMITVANGTTVVLDLAGKTLAATDNTEKNYSAIDNRGDLTIRDSSEEGNGKMTVEATVNNGWNRYSAVIANNPGGKLTVLSGTLEHLGGTDMAYGIDNLTNGKGTYAETEINGGTIKSTYRGIRQFLNGVEAENILTINGGTVEGVNKSIFFHDPSENANTGTLNIGEDAAIKGDIYLFVTENSTAWPVDVYVAKEALEGESTIISKNVPATYHVLEYPAYWTVECDVLEELTIVDGEDAEYINLIQKSVGTLTYERTFDNTEWQTLYLPFEVPVADLMDKFEFAYIYNASNKNNVLIDYVVIEDETTVLAANYPYLIRAREAGDKSIVVTDATLMPTEENTIDCSSVFETFTFKGNYSTIELSEDYTLEGGAWNKASTLNPFRFYLQIESRGTNNTTVKEEAIVLRRVTANGNPTGIEGVESDQNEGVDYIFDLHGRRVTEPQKGGIYIVNGKKILF